jgi:hypothetical protein
MRLALLLSKITNPVIMALLFVMVFAPFGILMRLLGKDLLRLKPDPAANSYWVVRTPPGPQPESMSNQF